MTWWALAGVMGWGAGVSVGVDGTVGGGCLVGATCHGVAGTGMTVMASPETDEEWIEVWSAGMTLAESGNLLMMPPRAVDNGDWIRLSTDLVDAGLKAAQVAMDRDFEGVLAVGEEVYNVCVECHQTYVPTLPDL